MGASFHYPPGCRADLVILQCRDEAEALRLKPAPLFVIRAGKVIAHTPAVTPSLRLGDMGETDVHFGYRPTVRTGSHPCSDGSTVMSTPTCTFARVPGA